MTPVLLVSAGGFQGLGMLRALQALPQVRAIVADIHADSITRYACVDYRVVPPLSDEAGFGAAVLDIVREQQVAAVIPSTAHELRVLSRMGDALRALGAAVAVCPAALLDTLLDKHLTAGFLAAHGIDAQQEVDPHRHDFVRPLFGRPRDGWGGRDTLLLRTTMERDSAAAAGELDRRTWSLFVDAFEEYSADFAVDPDGGTSQVVLRRRIRTSGGFAVISESVFDQALEALAARVAGALATQGGRGFFNVQLLCPADGSAPLVSDVNPRFGTSFGHCLSEGINLAAFYLGFDGNAASTRRPAKTVRQLHDIAIRRLPTPPAAVVFDLDDTLVDHKLWFVRKAMRAHADVASTWADRETFLLHALALVDEGERRQFVDRLCEALHWDAARHASFLAAFREAVIETPVHADAAACLARLRKAGLRLALLTDNPPATQRRKLDAAPALADAFDAVVFARDTGAEKPDPRPFAAVADTLGLPAPALCMVGDNLFRDCIGALRAGYGSAILLARDGAFLQPHRRLRELAGVDHDSRLVQAPDLIIAGEILLNP